MIFNNILKTNQIYSYKIEFILLHRKYLLFLFLLKNFLILVQLYRIMHNKALNIFVLYQIFINLNMYNLNHIKSRLLSKFNINTS